MFMSTCHTAPWPNLSGTLLIIAVSALHHLFWSGFHAGFIFVKVRGGGGGWGEGERENGGEELLHSKIPTNRMVL